MFTKIRAIIIAVKDVDEALKTYKDNFGMEAYHIDNQPQLGVKRALIHVGDGVIEFIAPLDPPKGAGVYVAEFLQTHGEGAYMVALSVDNKDSAIKSMTEKGVKVINTDPELQAKGFPVIVLPKSAKGIRIDLVEER